MLQAPLFDGLSLDPFSLQQDGLATPEVDVGGGEIVQALVIAPVVVVIDEGCDLGFEIARQEVVLQQDSVLQRLVPALDLALGLGMARCTPGVIHVAILKSFRLRHHGAFHVSDNMDYQTGIWIEQSCPPKAPALLKSAQVGRDSRENIVILDGGLRKFP